MHLLNLESLVNLFYLLLIVLLDELFYNIADISGGHELPGYYPHDEDRGAIRVTRDIDSIGASYDRYLRSAVFLLLINCSDFFANYSL